MKILVHWFSQVIDFMLHLDRYLGAIIKSSGHWAYGILFAIIFCETGLVVTPFLPGDSLLFAVGAFTALGAFRLEYIIPLLMCATILGDNTNYWIGRGLGPKVFSRDDSAILNKKHLERTRQFYEKHGGKTIIIARFVPIIRTFAPFVAGVGAMRYRRFIGYSLLGGFAWVGLFVSGGYFFGNMAFVKDHFSIVIAAIIVVSLLPVAIEFIKHRRAQ